MQRGRSREGPASLSAIPSCEEALEQESPPFGQVTHEQAHDTPVEADADGRLWLLVGTDSGFEGRTTIVYQSIDVTLTPSQGG